jgi:hypothetical protein
VIRRSPALFPEDAGATDRGLVLSGATTICGAVGSELDGIVAMKAARVLLLTGASISSLSA